MYGSRRDQLYEESLDDFYEDRLAQFQVRVAQYYAHESESLSEAETDQIASVYFRDANRVRSLNELLLATYGEDLDGFHSRFGVLRYPERDKWGQH